MNGSKTKELGLANYLLIGLSLLLFLFAILACIASVKFGAYVILLALASFTAGMLLPASDFKPEQVAAAAPAKKAAAPEPVKADQPTEKETSRPRAVIPLPETTMRDGRVFEKHYYYSDVEFESGGEPGELCRGAAVELTPEGNEMNLSSDGVIFGKMRANNLRKMVFDWQKKEQPVLARINSRDPLTMEMAFYSSPAEQGDYEARGIPSKVFRLSGVNSADYEFMAPSAEVGERVDVTYDVANERYETEYGYLPKSAEDFIEDDTIGFIEYAEENEDLKYVIKVRVYEEKIWL